MAEKQQPRATVDLSGVKDDTYVFHGKHIVVKGGKTYDLDGNAIQAPENFKPAGSRAVPAMQRADAPENRPGTSGSGISQEEAGDIVRTDGSVVPQNAGQARELHGGDVAKSAAPARAEDDEGTERFTAEISGASAEEPSTRKSSGKSKGKSASKSASKSARKRSK